MSAHPNEDRHREKLGHHAKDDDRGEGKVVKNPDRGAAKKPANPVTGGKQAEGGSAAIDRHHGRNRCRNDRFMHAIPNPQMADPSSAGQKPPRNTSGANNTETSVKSTSTMNPCRSNSRPNTREPVPLTAMATA